MDTYILFNANIITMDPARPLADLIAIDGNQIVSVAEKESFNCFRKRGTRAIDCAGQTLLPGFIDAHCHVCAYVESLVSLNLSPDEGVDSITDIQRKIRGVCLKQQPGTWIRGKGYNEFYLAEQRHPNRRDLDAAAPLHPVKLSHRSGHAHVLNSLGLKNIGITRETGDPPEGMIDRDLASGELTGILYGMGGYLAQRIPPLEDAEMERGVVLADEALLSCGITSLQDATFHNDLRQWRRFEAWKKRGILHPRLSMMIGFESYKKSKKQEFSTGIVESELKQRGVKIIVDRIRGSLHPDQKSLNEMIASIHDAGFQASIHAVEESVVEAACNAIEYALNGYPRGDHRHRIEHCSVCSQDLQRRLARLGIAVVTQPSFIYYSGDRYMKTVPADQLSNLYPIGSMLKNGLLVGAGSDFPIANANPFVGIHAAVTRMTESCECVMPEHKISLSDALNMYTSWAAAVNFEEGIKGSLSPGKMADLIVVSENPFEVDARKLKEIRVLLTMLGGRVVWSDGTVRV